MVCLVRNRNKFYKKTLLDVWGYHKLYKKSSKLIFFIKVMRAEKRARKLYYKKEFVFSLATRIRFRWRKKLKKKYINPRYLYNFYLTIRRKTFRRYAYIARRRPGLVIGNYLNFIEGRLFMLVYRANFINNIFKLKHIIDKGVFLVNGHIRNYSNFVVKVGEIVQVSFKYKKLLKNDMRLRFRLHNIFWSPRKYIFVNYKFFFIFFLRQPKLRELKFPIRFDLYAGGDLYFL